MENIFKQLNTPNCLTNSLEEIVEHVIANKQIKAIQTCLSVTTWDLSKSKIYINKLLTMNPRCLYEDMLEFKKDIN